MLLGCEMKQDISQHRDRRTEKCLLGRKTSRGPSPPHFPSSPFHYRPRFVVTRNDNSPTLYKPQTQSPSGLQKRLYNPQLNQSTSTPPFSPYVPDFPPFTRKTNIAPHTVFESSLVDPYMISAPSPLLFQPGTPFAVFGCPPPRKAPANPPLFWSCRQTHGHLSWEPQFLRLACPSGSQFCRPDRRWAHRRRRNSDGPERGSASAPGSQGGS